MKILNRRIVFILIVSLFFTLMLQQVWARFSDPEPLLMDVSKVVGVNSCGECHAAEVDSWKQTHHARSFREMHRSDKGKAIARKLGIRRIKNSDQCQGCHYTPMIAKTGKTRVKHGVSCETCHGEAADWVNLHGNYGGKTRNKDNETLEHRQKRLELCIVNGMRWKGKLYPLAAQCVSCHVVPDERLVNVGGHPAGNGFDLYTWSQGEVRHNFLDSDGSVNRVPSQTHKRMLYLTGLALQLEYALRGAATARGPGPYLTSVQKRFQKARKELQRIHKALGESGGVKPLMTAVFSVVDLSTASKADLEKAARQVSISTRWLLDTHDGTRFVDLDPLLPGEKQYKGLPWKKTG